MLLRELEECKKAETDPHSGKIFAYVYTTDNDCFRVVEKAMEMFRDADPQATPTTSSSSEQESKRGIVEMFHNAFLHENALNPLVFPSLRKFEVEAVSMVADMLHGGAECVGNVTSGGTESILTAVKTYRDRARKLFPSITKPELVSDPQSARTGEYCPCTCLGGTPYHPPRLPQSCRLLWSQRQAGSSEL